MLDAELAAIIESTTGRKIRSVRVSDGGSISQGAVVTCDDGNSVFAKWNRSAPEGFFAAEASGLKEMALVPEVKVPAVLFIQDLPCNGPPCILIEAFPAVAKSKNAEGELAEQLAALHCRRAPTFGFHEDNFIGLTPQRNTRAARWEEFFIDQRLRPQIELGEKNGWARGEIRKLFESKIESFRALLGSESEPPSLLHGDLWSGNVLWSTNGPVLIDPAVYYGNREVDLAMMELFGGFSAAFFDTYQHCLPLQPGYHNRKEVLNLYQLMNHANLFGGSYVSSVRTVLQSTKPMYQ